MAGPPSAPMVGRRSISHGELPHEIAKVGERLDAHAGLDNAVDLCGLQTRTGTFNGDPKFKADAARLQIDLTPMTGEQVRTSFARSTPRRQPSWRVPEAP